MIAKFYNPQDAFVQLLEHVVEEGDVITVRGSETKEVRNVAFSIKHPTQRCLLLPHRNDNIFAKVAETLWVLAGRNDITWLKFFLPRAPEWSDDGTTWRGGYGKRLRHWHLHGAPITFADQLDLSVDQINECRQLLIEESNTRRAVMSLWDPASDYQNSKDIPCNGYLHWLIRGGKIHLNITQRSSDVLWGFCLAGDTEIPLVDGSTKTLKQLAEEHQDEFWVYSMNSNGKIVQGRAHHARKTKRVLKSIVVTLDNGCTLKSTLDHKFMLRNGSYIKAENLRVGDSLMPWYTMIKNSELWIKQGDWWERAHRMLYTNTTGKELGTKDAIHHKNGNHADNHPDNLMHMSRSEHASHHVQERWKDGRAYTKKFVETCKRKTILYNRSELGRKNSSINGKRVQALHGDRIRSSEKFLQACSKQMTRINADTEVKKKQMHGRKRELLRKLGYFEYYEDLVEDIMLARRDGRVWRNAPIPTFEEAQQIYTELYDNHKVASIECVEGYVDMYDITVDDYENFATSAGVFVHNSGINLFEWGVLQDMMASWTGCEVGELTYFISSLHLYQQHYERANKILAADIGADLYINKFSSFVSPKPTVPFDQLDDMLDMIFNVVDNVIAGNQAGDLAMEDKFFDLCTRMVCLFAYDKVHRDHPKRADALCEMLSSLPTSDFRVAAIEYYMRTVPDVVAVATNDELAALRSLGLYQ